MATIKDVANLAGVSVATVSRMMNNRGVVSDKTRRKVMRAMKELSYRPNEMARALQTRKKPPLWAFWSLPSTIRFSAV